MRYAETNHVKGSILVSPYYTDLDDGLEKQSGYFEKPWSWESIRNNQGKIVVFSGDNDPYTPQQEFRFVMQKLDAEVHEIPGGEHFIDQSEFSELLQYILSTYPIEN